MRRTTPTYSRYAGTHGFTLIEVIIVIIIAGILVTVALKSASTISDSARVEETKDELDRLAKAVVGDPAQQNNGVRNDFGYVGDIGALPPSLDALAANPGGYSTWSGPYISNRFAQFADDFKTDPWGTPYALTGTEIISTGSGLPIVKPLAGNLSALLYNSVAGTVFDYDGTPPGVSYKDSLSVVLTVPDGSGGLLNRFATPDAGGFFAFDSIPVGNHDIEIVYKPTADSMRRFVSVLPNTDLYSEYFLTEDLWNAEGAVGVGLTLVNGSDSLGDSHCNQLVFWLQNTGSDAITIDNMALSWSSPTAYFDDVTFNGIPVYSAATRTSGDVVVFTTPQTIAAGISAAIQIADFREFSNGGGPKVDMSGVSFTVEFSDGSEVAFVADACY